MMVANIIQITPNTTLMIINVRALLDNLVASSMFNFSAKVLACKITITNNNFSHIIGKHKALSRKVICNYRLYVKIGRTSVKPSWKHWTFRSNYRCLHTGVPYNIDYGWNRLNVKAQILALYLYVYMQWFIVWEHWLDTLEFITQTVEFWNR